MCLRHWHYSIILTFSLLFFKAASAQNWVPNPSFEDYKKLPCTIILDTTGFKLCMNNWFLPTLGSTDIYSTLVDSMCILHSWSFDGNSRGLQTPRTGNVMLGAILYSDLALNDYREYFAVKLDSALVIGTTYYAEMFVSFADRSKIAHNNIGMNFSVNPDTAYNNYFFRNLPRQPEIVDTTVITDIVNWVKISGTFVADSAYNYLSIGNFFDKQSTTIRDSSKNVADKNSYYFFDDITVEEACGILSGPTLYCEGDTIILDAGSSGLAKWAIATDSNYIISSKPILKYIAKDSATFLLYNRCDTQAIHVDVIPKKLVDMGGYRQLCSGDSIELNAYFPNAQYLWSTGATDSVIYANTPGTYWVEFFYNGCQGADTINILAIDVSLQPDTSICDGSELMLDAFNRKATYLWQDGSTDSIFTVTKTGEYWVLVDVDGCIVSDTVHVQLKNCATIINMPNVFTPNGDGVNDFFETRELNNIAEIHITIFNRWGSLVHESWASTVTWDGTFNNNPCPAGVYFWTLTFTDFDGLVNTQNGATTLFR